MKEPTNSQLSKAIKGVQGTVDKLARAVATFASDTAHRFDGVDKRLDKVEHRLDGVEHRLDGVETAITELRIDVEDIKKTMSSFVTKQDLEDAIAIVRRDIMRPVNSHDDMVYAVIDVLKENKTITDKQAEYILTFDFRRT